jgi:hypothetical protein
VTLHAVSVFKILTLKLKKRKTKKERKKKQTFCFIPSNMEALQHAV